MSKPKKCKVCKDEFKPFQAMQKVCSPRCALVLVKEDNKKAYKKETKALKKKLRDDDKRYWVKRVQDQAFNPYIRARDRGQPCISCGRNTGAKMNAGHYLTVGGHPELRFDEDNCHLQCEHCNSHLSGNAARYRINLIKKIGIERVERLEGPHEPKKYTIDDLKAMEKHYKSEVKRMMEELWLSESEHLGA